MDYICPHCDTTLEGDADLAGVEADCPSCCQRFRLEPVDGAPPDEEPAEQVTAATLGPLRTMGSQDLMRSVCPHCREPHYVDAMLRDTLMRCTNCSQQFPAGLDAPLTRSERERRDAQPEQIEIPPVRVHHHH